MGDSKDLTTEEQLLCPENPSKSFGTAKEILARHTHCAICGAYLHFTHFTDFAKNITQELARCPECGIRVKRRYHSLQ